MKRLIELIVPQLVYKNFGPPMSPSVKESWVDPNCTGWLSIESESSSPPSPILLTLGSDNQKESSTCPDLPAQLLSPPLLTSSPQLPFLPQNSDQKHENLFEMRPLNTPEVEPSQQHELTSEENETLDMIEDIVQAEMQSSPPQAQPIPPLYEL